jgi:hypothetical protein
MTMEEVNEHVAYWFRFEARSREEAQRMRAWLVRGATNLQALSRDRVAKVTRG